MYCRFWLLGPSFLLLATQTLKNEMQSYSKVKVRWSDFFETQCRKKSQGASICALSPRTLCAIVRKLTSWYLKTMRETVGIIKPIQQAQRNVHVDSVHDVA